MKSYIVSYEINYKHDVSYFVNATDRLAAEAKVREALRLGTAWDKGNPDFYIVHDYFEEGPGPRLEYFVLPSTPEEREPDRTVQLMRLHEQSPRLLIAAKQVIKCWEQGDLAQSVRELASIVKEAEQLK